MAVGKFYVEEEMMGDTVSETMSSREAEVSVAPIAAVTQMMKRRPRLFYLDLVRALATLLVVLSHFNNPFLSDGRYLLTNQPFGIYVGDLGVSLFLIISGAALAYTYERPVDLRRFYWKRFKGIYPAFWIAWLLGTLYFFVALNGVPPNAAPARSLIWTLLGVDGLASVLGFTTAYLLGEWFLGFIILFYVVFPLLLWCVDRFPKTSAMSLLLIFAVTFVVMKTYFPSIPGSVILTMRLPELAFGIYLVRHIRRVHPFSAIGAGLVLLANSLWPAVLPKDVGTALVGISTFLILVAVARYVAIGPVRLLIEWGQSTPTRSSWYTTSSSCVCLW